MSNRTRLTTPSGTVTYTFDKYNQLRTVTDPTGDITAYTYDKAGNLTSTLLPNGVTETRAYDSLNRLTQVQSAKNGNTLFSAAYTLDNAGMRTRVVETGRTVDYSYDALYRLLSETDGSQTRSYTYDAVGNRLTKTDASGTTSYTYNANDQLLTDGTTTYTYDNNGNKTSETTAGVTITYDWDAENRLKGMQKLGTTVSYDYDHDGVRVSQTVNGAETRYLVDKNRDYAQVIEEFDGITSQVLYVHGLDLIEQIREGVQSIYLVDGLGSVRALTDGDGNLTDSYLYDAYGNLLNSSGTTENSYRFTGEQFDPQLQEYYLRARYYDPSTGRFTARDPFEGVFEEPLSLHKYGYVHGNPVNGTDPSGLLKFETLAGQVVLNILRAIPALSPTAALGVAATVDSFIAAHGVKILVASGVASLAAIEEYVRRNGIPTLVFAGNNLEEHAHHVVDTQLGLGNTKGRVEQLRRLQQFPYTPPFRQTITPNFIDAARKQGEFISPFLVGPHMVSLGFYVPIRARVDQPVTLDNALPVNGLLGLPARTLARDEFPFASTTGGGDTRYNNNRVSVRYVSDLESRRQGGLIRQFYRHPSVDLNNTTRRGILWRGQFVMVGVPWLKVQSGFFGRDGK